MDNRTEIGTDSTDTNGSHGVIEFPVIEFPDDDLDLDVAEHPFDAAERVLAATP